MISPHTCLESKGTKASLYIIIRGTVIEKSGSIDDSTPYMMLHESEILGFQNILPHFAEKSISNLFTTRYAMASVVQLDISSLIPLLENKEVQKRLWHRIACRLIMLHPDVFPKLVDFDYRALKKLVNQVNI